MRSGRVALVFLTALFVSLALASAAAARETRPYSTAWSREPSLDSANQQLYLDVVAVRPGDAIAGLNDAAVEEFFYKAGTGGDAEVAEKQDISNCVKAVAGGNARIALEFNPLCQRCGGNYFVTAKAGFAKEPLKYYSIREQFAVPCKADVLLVTDAKKLAKDPEFEPTLKD